MEDEAKKENGETNKWGAKILAPTLKFCQELSQTKKKKRWNFIWNGLKIKIQIQSFQVSFKPQIFYSKFFIPKFSIPHSQCPIFKSKPSVFKISEKFKPQISWSKFQVLIFKILNLKISDFKFQISSQNLKVSKFQNFKCQFQNFQVSKIKCFSKIEFFVN